MGGRDLGSQATQLINQFHRALGLQFLVVPLILVVGLAVLWSSQRRRLLERSTAVDGGVRTDDFVEAPARHWLRIGFGVLWLFDALLQCQASMPGHLATDVIGSSAVGSPGWVNRVAEWSEGVWNHHPVTAAVAVVWIQAGIGLWMIAARRGWWSRWAGLASALWALVIWVFAESFGSLFAPGQSWLFGAPGSALLYAVGGVLVALPEAAWFRPTFGRRLVRIEGLFFLVMGLWQAWPGRGFWSARHGAITAMVTSMAQTPQPGWISSVVGHFGSSTSSVGWLLNAVVVMSLIGVGAGLVSGLSRPVQWAVIGGVIVCTLVWIFVQDFGFLGGVGTDPNSMPPLVVLLVAGALAMRAVAPPPQAEPAWSGLDNWWRTASPTEIMRTYGGAMALGVTALGVLPLAVIAPH